MPGVIEVTIYQSGVYTAFYVAEALLKNKAAFLVEILDGMPLPRGMSCLDDVEIKIFDIFLRWLSRETDVDNSQPTLSPLYVEYPQEMLFIVKVYIFAEEYNIPQLCMDVLYYLSAYIQRQLLVEDSNTTDKACLIMFGKLVFERCLGPKKVRIRLYAYPSRLCTTPLLCQQRQSVAPSDRMMARIRRMARAGKG